MRVTAYVSKMIKLMKGGSSFKLEFQGVHFAITKEFHDYLGDHKFEALINSNPLAREVKSKRTSTDISNLA